MRTMSESLQELSTGNIEKQNAMYEMLHHFYMIQDFLKNNNPEGADLYIHNAIEKFSEEEEIHTSNPYIDALLSYEKRKNEGIHFEVNMFIPEDCDVNPIDMALALMCMINAQLRNVNTEKDCTLVIIGKPIEENILLYTNIKEADTPLHLEDLEQSIIQRILDKYHGLSDMDIHNTGDHSICLKNKLSSMPN